MGGRSLQAIRYLYNRWILRRRFLEAYSPDLQARFLFKTEDVVGRTIYKHGTYDKALTTYLLENLKASPGEVIFDIGANIGWYTVLFDRISPPDIRIYAFEPDPLNYSLLTQNLASNELDRVVPVNAALSDTTGTQTLYLYPDKNRGKHSLLPVGDGDQVEVRTLTLDQFWEEEGLGSRPLRFLKIDVEGYEYFVYRGGIRLLRRCQEVLMEFSTPLMVAGGIDPASVCRLLVDAGLSPRYVRDGRLESVGIEDLLGESETVDVLWVRD